jgi:hypothetical protein
MIAEQAADRPVDAPGTSGKPGARRRWRWDASVLVAIVSVAVALVYNSLQTRDSARQLSQGQQSLQLSARASEFDSLIAVHERIVRADARVRAAVIDFRNTNAPFVDRASRVLQEITPLEGIAYLLNHRVVALNGARGLWGPYLACNYFVVRGILGERLKPYTTELAAFHSDYVKTELKGRDERLRCP